MSKTRVVVALGCCVFALVVAVWAQAVRKPGLWEMTANMTWQQSPMPNGMTMPGGGPHTTKVCLTQARSTATARRSRRTATARSSTSRSSRAA